MASARVTQAEIEEGLERLGLGQGDVAFVHSSLSAFGYVTGGAQAVVRALLAVLGPEGTLAVPIFRSFFWEGPDQVWDRQRSPSLMGAISETVRTWPGAVPGHHAPHPIAALGKYAGELSSRRNRSDFAFDSPFSLLLELNAWILLVGVNFNCCTFIHLLEERARVPYREWVELHGTVVDDDRPRREVYPFFRRRGGVHNDFRPLGRLLSETDLVTEAQVGDSRLRAVRVRDLYETGLRALRRDPLFLVSKETRARAQCWIPDHGAWLRDQGRNPGRTLEPEHSLARRLAVCLHVRRPSSVPRVETWPTWHTSDGLELRQLCLRGGPSRCVPAMLARPAGPRRNLPAVICLHGTGGTWERMMEKRLQPRDSHLLGWAREICRHGFAVLAVTQLAHPPRPEPWDWEWPKLLQLYGQTAMGRLVADVSFCADYLSRLDGIDPDRIGVAGFSLGGIAALYAFAVDPRLNAAVTFCGGVGSVEELVRACFSGFHSVYFHVPRLLREGLDHPQLVDAMVPRHLLVCGTEDDKGMPLAGLRRFASAAEQTYAAAGVASRFECHVEPGPHAMGLTAFRHAVDWFEMVLGSAGDGGMRQRKRANHEP